MSVADLFLAPLRRLTRRPGPSVPPGTVPPGAVPLAGTGSRAGGADACPAGPGAATCDTDQREPALLAPRRADAGMTTAEYAVGTVAACGFAAVLFRIVRSQAVLNVLTDVITRALHTI
jgi:hypothetical protein